MGSWSKVEIEKFTGLNDFGLWKVKMKAMLVHQGLWRITGIESSNYKSKDAYEDEILLEKAHSSVLLNLGDTVLRKVTKETSAKGVWERLESLYMTKRLFLKQALYNFKMTEDKTVLDQVDTFNKIIVDLENIEVNIPLEDQALILLSALPKGFESIKDSMLYGRDAITVEDVKAALNAKTLSDGGTIKKAVESLNVRGRSNKKESKRGSSRSKSRTGVFKGKCFKCKKEGHMKKDCPDFKKTDSEDGDVAIAQQTYESAEVLVVGDETELSEWVVDSGCSSFDDTDLGTVLLGNDQTCKVPGSGSVELKMVEESVRRLEKHREYRQTIISNYQRLHRELYTMEAPNFFVPSFHKAILENTEQAFRSIMTEPSPGIFTFEMLQPRFCEMLLAEVENFEKWVHETKFRITRPTTMSKYGVVLDDFGMETMLDKLMEEFIRPISKVFFSDVGGSTLVGHHGFVVEYGIDRDVDSGFHVDDSEVTLNVCLGKHFSGGELFFRGVRCDKHVNSETQSEEIFDYSHVPGHAVLHRGRHRHGARATTAGHRMNLLVWCRSSVFRELRKYQKDFSSWCSECHREKKERQQKDQS